MDNTKNLIGTNFKVKNTWQYFKTWEEDGLDKFLAKVTDTLKSVLKLNYEMGRVIKSEYLSSEQKFYFKTKTKTFYVKLGQGANMNNGTWFTIIKIDLTHSN